MCTQSQVTALLQQLRHQLLCIQQRRYSWFFFEPLTYQKLAKSSLLTIHHPKTCLFLGNSILCPNLLRFSKSCPASRFPFEISPCYSQVTNFPVLVVLSSCKIHFILTTHPWTALSSRGGWWMLPKHHNLLHTCVICGTMTTATPPWSTRNWRTEFVTVCFEALYKILSTTLTHH